MRKLLLCLLPACAATSPAPMPPAPLAPTVAASASVAPAPSYVAAFDDLVKRIEHDHVFPPGYVRDVGHAFRDDVPRLREELANARNRTEALVALSHLQNSLRDRHCGMDPPADLPRRRLTLGVELWAGGTAAAPEVRVEEIVAPDAKTSMATGDRVVSVDGAPIAAWIAAHPFESRALPPSQWLADTIARIGRADLPWSTVKEGDPRVLGVVHDGQTREVTLHFRRHFPEAEKPDLDRPPPMARIECEEEPVDYGDYRLAAMGVNVCVYQPKAHARPRVPLVHFTSFNYGGSPVQSLRMVRVDHDVLARELRDADAVVLDVHDNHGGNNPFIFAGWFSSGPWDHERVVTRVVPDLDAATISEVMFGEQYVQAYVDAQRAGQPTVTNRFLCDAGHCEHDTPDPSERVTKAPVALVTGPSCVSSCDTLALTWASFHLGPVVGRQPAHAYTVARLPIHVAGPASEDLGRLRIALSRSELADGASMEGEPLAMDWEAPSSFEGRTTWVREAVVQAKKRLVRR